LRLKLLAGDYVAALGGSLQRAQRYNDAHGYRDYLGMLHAMGHSTDAWSAFMVLAPQLRAPQIWETVLVGHKVAGASETEVAQWSKQGEFKGLGDVRSTAAAHLLRFATTDRIPSKELSAALEGLDYPTWLQEQGFVVREGATSDLIMGQHTATKATTATISARVRTRVRSDLAYFAEGYRAIKTGDFAAARATFEEAATFYNMPGGPASYMLPYRALAAAKLGDTASVEALMAEFSETDKAFDYYLAKAAIAAIGGNADEAVAALNLARYQRPFTEERPLLTQYTYGDICEVLARLTGNSQIRQLALSWAKSNQAVEPWHAWGYAMEAHLTKDPRERQRAIAMLYYLDPRSERLVAFRKGEVEAAVKARSNPFLRPLKRAKEEATT
jgi:tetratricopeptide (TPR) repeat protein